jgi:hypothetical protein
VEGEEGGDWWVGCCLGGGEEGEESGEEEGLHDFDLNIILEVCFCQRSEILS